MLACRRISPYQSLMQTCQAGLHDMLLLQREEKAMLCSTAAAACQAKAWAQAIVCMLHNSTLPAGDLLGAALCGCCCRAWQRTQMLWDRSWTPCIGPAALPERYRVFRRQQAAIPG